MTLKVVDEVRTFQENQSHVSHVSGVEDDNIAVFLQQIYAGISLCGVAASNKTIT